MNEGTIDEIKHHDICLAQKLSDSLKLMLMSKQNKNLSLHNFLYLPTCVLKSENGSRHATTRLKG